jgi:flagellar basal-body rod protein FlgB
MKISEALDIHEQAIRARSARLEVLSTNIANADTPNFKARDIDFRAVMNKVQADSMNTTNMAHFATSTPDESQPGMRYRIPYNTSQDGNTVEMPVEQAQYGKAAVDFRASLMFLENRVAGIKRALRGE